MSNIDYQFRTQYKTFNDDLFEKLLDEEWANLRVESMGPSEEERHRIRLQLLSLLDTFLDKIPKEERDFLLLYYIEGAPQRSIGNLFGITQRAVSYRISRAVERLRYLVEIAEVEEEDMREDLNALFNNTEATDITCLVFRYTNLSEVQRIVNKTFFFVRSRFCAMLDDLKQVDVAALEAIGEAELASRVPEYLRVLGLVVENFGMLKPQKKLQRSWGSYYLG